MRSILLLPLVAMCLETRDMRIWRMFVFMSVVVTVWVSVGMFDVSRALLKIVFLNILLLYIFIVSIPFQLRILERIGSARNTATGRDDVLAVFYPGAKVMEARLLPTICQHPTASRRGPARNLTWTLVYYCTVTTDE